MANIKLDYGSSTETTWNSTGRITSPSLILVDGGTTRYTPIYSGSAGGTITDGNYKSTLGHLIVADKRVALSRWQYKFTDSVTIGHYFTQIINSHERWTEVSCGCYARDYYWTRTTDVYIIVRGTSIGNGSLKYIAASGGYSTTSTSEWKLTCTTIAENPTPQSSVNYTLVAVFTSSAGTDFTVSKTCTIYKNSEHTDTLSKEITI